VLCESEDKYRTLFETMQQGVFYQQADGQLIDVNPAALKMFGLTRDEFLSRTSDHAAWDVVYEDGSPIPAQEHPSMVALKTGQPVNDVVAGVFNSRTQNYTWMIINATPQFRTGETVPYQVAVALHNITELKQAQERLP
jgi:two-component system, cell cycle sensor histidine kinase and response regulator CckA